MTIFYVVSGILAAFYIFIISKYLYHWGKLDDWQVPSEFAPSVFVSVLIPARNEAENISACLQSVLDQSYPHDLYEIIVIDDHSDDETSTIVNNSSDSRLQLLKLSDLKGLVTSKKKAITEGVSKAKGQLIVTTDADCIVKKDWLKAIVSYYEAKSVKFIAAPVNFYQENNLFEKFQSLDFLGMMGVTGAGIHGRFMNMCNGANLAYEKKVFHEVGGFEGIDHLASGDDMLLMQKIAQKYPHKIGFLKNTHALVLTKAQPDLNSFINQRLRWASKSNSYKEWQVTFILAMVFLFCVSIVLSLLLSPFFGITMIFVFAAQLMVKVVMDFLFLNRMSDFFNRKDLMRIFLPAQFLHIAYIVGIGFLAQFVKRYTWKGRKTK